MPKWMIDEQNAIRNTKDDLNVVNGSFEGKSNALDKIKGTGIS